MKSNLLLLFMFFSLTCLSQTLSKKTIASSCHDGEGRCTGSAYCSACKNCSRCAHCSSGGSCGVCSSNVNYETTTIKLAALYKIRWFAGSLHRKNDFEPRELLGWLMENS